MKKQVRFLTDWLRHRRAILAPVLSVLALVWLVGFGAMLRVDAALVDFLGHAKDMSIIHSATPDSPASFTTADGAPIDAASLQDLHDEDTQMLHGARNRLIFVVLVMLSVPLAILGFLAWLAGTKANDRKPRGR